MEEKKKSKTKMTNHLLNIFLEKEFRNIYHLEVMVKIVTGQLIPPNENFISLKIKTKLRASIRFQINNNNNNGKSLIWIGKKKIMMKTMI